MTGSFYNCFSVYADKTVVRHYFREDHPKTNDKCVYYSPSTDEEEENEEYHWRVSDCNVKRAFICQFREFTQPSIL